MTTSTPLLSHPKYRPDIDGLRAVAVLSVVAFHAFPAWLKGGFIGVDVFFVISGFLISTIIFENLENGSFNFSEFYVRRIKRIFPALLFVLIASFAFGWFVLLADEYKQLGKHIAAGAGFLSNFVLWSEAGYFDNSAETKPLLHLWSLGIEEQFYIFSPFILWFAWKRNFNLLTLTIIFIFISFTLNVTSIKTNSVATFYSPQTRFWELLSGSLLAWLVIYKENIFVNLKLKIDGCLSKVIYKNPIKNDGILLCNVLSFIGGLLLAYGFWRINKNVSFPGYWPIIPVVGSILIIVAGPKAWVNRNILSNKFAVWFGLISFPLYLWHWPLLSFARIMESEVPSPKIRIAAVLLSIVLAWLTYKFIERPVRLSKAKNYYVGILIGCMLVVGFVGYITYHGDGLKFRKVIAINTDLKSGSDGGDQGNMIVECGNTTEQDRKLFRVCAQDKRGNVRFALLGDSKADSFHTGLVRTSTDHGRWLFIGGNGPNGSPTPLLSSYPDPNRPLTNIAIKAIVENKDIEVVAIITAIRSVFTLSDGVKGGNLATYDYKYLEKLPASGRSDAAFKEMNRVVEIFVSAGKRVILVVDNPALPNPQDCINRRSSSDLVNVFLGKFNNDCTIRLNDFKEQTKNYMNVLLNIQRTHPNSVRIFDPTEIYCDSTKGVCEAVREGRLLYSYTDHISDYASGLAGAGLNKFIQLNYGLNN
jgi:peptidoglycan/LPS O-acetylase OafA/YrhL